MPKYLGRLLREEWLEFVAKDDEDARTHLDNVPGALFEPSDEIGERTLQRQLGNGAYINVGYVPVAEEIHD